MIHFNRLINPISGSNKTALLVVTLFIAPLIICCQNDAKKNHLDSPIMTFSKKQISSESYETVGVFDVNNDKIDDIVSGAFWYEGPDFLKWHPMGSAKRFGQYWEDFSTIPIDVNGDGRLDVITGGWFEGLLIWKENIEKDGPWPENIIAQTGNIETTRTWDIDGDGIKEIIPNTPNDSLVIYRLILDGNGRGTGKFNRYKIHGENGHGLGFGDVNHDGRGDFIVHNGWLEAPNEPYKEKWIFHQDFDFGHASIPIIVEDFNSDGLNDLIVGQGHDYGLDWYEQGKKNDKTVWIKHPIDPDNSQFHTMEWEDLDGDGHKELITGKRFRSHNGRDPGGNDPVGIYLFKWNGEGFTKQVIDYGKFGKGKGTGLSFAVKDLTKNGKKDIVVAGKDGLYIFYNN